MFRKKTEQQNIPEEAVPASYAALMRRAMIRSTVFAALAFVTAVLATMAWFASNRSTDSSGMQMQIEASANLIIGKEKSEITSFLSLADRTSVTFGAPETANIMRPATHDGAQYTNNVLNANKTGLKYNTNPTEVSFSTGVAKGEIALTFAEVPKYAAGEPRYYVDYTVYLASAGKAMEAKSLTAKLDFNGAAPNPIEDHYNAASVDFYLDGLDGTYKGTLNLAGRDTASLDLMGDSTDDNSSVTIPFHKADANNCLTVMMRFYFDGALEKLENPGRAYVYSDNLSPADLNLKVSFEAVAPAEQS